MAKTEVRLPEGARLVITKDEHGPKEIYDRLTTAHSAFIVTFNLPKAGGKLLQILDNATQLKELRIITNIPNWWESYYSISAKRNARKAIYESTNKLNSLAKRAGVEIYFTRRNHSKIYIVDDTAYVGSSNFSDESADNVEAGVVFEDANVADELRQSAWALLKPDARLHPTLATAAAESLANWLQDELQFDTIYWSVHDHDASDAQGAFATAVKLLLELARRTEAVLEDEHDPAWGAPLQAVVREAASLHQVNEMVGELEFSYGKIQSCINFSFESAITQHIISNCSDEETLEQWQEDGQRVADEEWEEVRNGALDDLRRVVEALEEVKKRVIENLRQFQAPIDNTGDV